MSRDVGVEWFRNVHLLMRSLELPRMSGTILLKIIIRDMRCFTSPSNAHGCPFVSFSHLPSHQTDLHDSLLEYEFSSVPPIGGSRVLLCQDPYLTRGGGRGGGGKSKEMSVNFA